MKSINFREFRLWADIRQTDSIIMDVSYQVADLLYKQRNGVMAHDLAMRIYKSEGPVSFTDEEMDFIEDFVTIMTPIFQDSFKTNVKER